ncbi:M20/M25/M40 family metallo-hydrolase [candidate division KSB1 bacterium]|nr:M20/M25/M40 family metallo-hydrolase [candidate division KSB1 bacterium]
MNNKIKALADNFQKDLIRFLRDIIAIPSMNGYEGAVIERIKKEMEETGYEKVWVDPMGNLFGQLGNGKKILAIDGHTDTVDIGDRKNWKVDPFGAEMKNDIIYGRGACDQKGGIAAAIYAGKIIREIGIPENITLLVVASLYSNLLTSSLTFRIKVLMSSGLNPIIFNLPIVLAKFQLSLLPFL